MSKSENIIRDRTPTKYELIESGKDKKGNFDVSNFEKPPWFDEKLFEDGKKFYSKFQVGCSFSMLVSLIMGLSFESLLKVLIFTERSETGRKAYWRYFHTLLHIKSWFETDVFDPNSSGCKSIKKIKRIHYSVALKITKSKGEPKDEKWVSQRDLSHTLIGFAGAILIAPASYGCTDTTLLEGFIHFWRVMGYLHGIEDQYNPFAPSMESAQETIVQVTEKMLIPGLENPPKNFHMMVQAISDWAGSKNGLIGYGIYTMVENVHKYRLDLDPRRANKLVQLFPIKSLREKMSFNWHYYLFKYIYTVPLIRILLNMQFEMMVWIMKTYMKVHGKLIGGPTKML